MLSAHLSISWLFRHSIPALIALVYVLLLFESHQAQGIPVESYLYLHGLASLLLLGYWIAVYLNKSKGCLQAPTAWTVLFWSAIYHLIGVFGVPILEDDFYRYLLDGCVFAHQGSPYGIPPSALFLDNQLSSDCNYALTWVNSPDLATIYGPTLQYIFLFAHWIDPGNIRILQIVFSLLDLILIALMLRLARPIYVVLYAWSPLVIKEIAFTSHPDIVGILLIMLAWVCIRSPRYFLVAALSCGLAVGSKVFALIIVPFVFYQMKWRLGLRYVIVTLLTICLLYLPFITHQHTDFSILTVFASSWTFNASVFYFTQMLVGDSAARLISILAFAIFWLAYCYWYYHRSKIEPKPVIPSGDILFGVFFLLGPVFNPWYLIWLLPFAVIRPKMWSWTLATCASLSYLTGVNLTDSSLAAYEVSTPAAVIQYGLVIFALLLDCLKAQKRPRNASLQH